ncbi:MAG: hypothetical protein WA855_05575 [Candidatus Acidiferrales bacterium]
MKASKSVPSVHNEERPRDVTGGQRDEREQNGDAGDTRRDRRRASCSRSARQEESIENILMFEKGAVSRKREGDAAASV